MDNNQEVYRLEISDILYRYFLYGNKRIFKMIQNNLNSTN